MRVRRRRHFFVFLKRPHRYCALCGKETVSCVFTLPEQDERKGLFRGWFAEEMDFNLIAAEKGEFLEVNSNLAKI